MAERCEHCGRPFSQPSDYSGCRKKHPAPDNAWVLTQVMEKTLSARKRVLCIDDCDEEIADEIRAELAETIRKTLLRLGLE